MKPIISPFKTAAQAERLIDKYFIAVQGIFHMELKQIKTGKDNTETIEHKVWDQEPEPVTISGLALALGFNSRHEFEDYERNGQFAQNLKRARLRVEAIYEAQLHQNTTGAMFALKTMGWNEKTTPALPNNEDTTILKIEIINTGPTPAGNEKDVEL